MLLTFLMETRKAKIILILRFLVGWATNASLITALDIHVLTLKPPVPIIFVLSTLHISF